MISKLLQEAYFNNFIKTFLLIVQVTGCGVTRNLSKSNSWVSSGTCQRGFQKSLGVIGWHVVLYWFQKLLEVFNMLGIFLRLLQNKNNSIFFFFNNNIQATSQHHTALFLKLNSSVSSGTCHRGFQKPSGVFGLTGLFLPRCFEHSSIFLASMSGLSLYSSS